MMRQVFRDVTMEWRGHTYTVTPSNRLLRKIEGELAPTTIAEIIQGLSASKLPLSQLSYIISEFLRSGGAPSEEANEDEIYAEIMDDLANNEGAGLVALCEALLLAVSPSERAGKNLTSASPAQRKEAESANPEASAGT